MIEMIKTWITKCQTCYDLEKIKSKGRIVDWETFSENQADMIKWIHKSNNTIHEVFTERI